MSEKQILTDEQIEEAIFANDIQSYAYVDDPVGYRNTIRTILATQPTPAQGDAVPVAVNDYSDMSREALERHATRMAQALDNDKARKFHDKYATGPMMPPSCLCCGQLPDKVAIRHAELPGIVICEKCATRQSGADAVDAALELAVSAIYFDDGSKYEGALWNIVRALSPSILELLHADPRAAFYAVKSDIAAQGGKGEQNDII